MTLNQERPPRTFGEWHAWRYTDVVFDKFRTPTLESAWDAAVASQQAEIERLVDHVSAQEDELHRYEAVVEAARAYIKRIEDEASRVEPWNAPKMDDGLRSALAALDSAQ